MKELVITNGMVMTMNARDELIDNGAVIIKGGRIEAVGPTKELQQQHPQAKELDASGMAVMPGLINTHTHLSMTMTRGIADDIDAVKWLPAIWAIEKYISPESVYAGAMLGIAEMIASGTTCFNDHYFIMEEVARAVEETGIRADLAEGIMENRNKKKGQKDLEKGCQFVSDWNGKADGRIRTRIGPHSLYTCSSELVEKSRACADELGVGMHMHVAESAMEVKLLGKSAKGPTSVQHLDALGIIRSDFVSAHGLNIDEEDMRILKERGSGIAHCPQAYGKVGGYPFPKVDQWLKAGVHVGIGTDGVASNNNLDIFDEMRFATMARKLQARDGRVLPARQILRIATIGGAEVLGLADEIGSLEAGKKADIILVDFRKPHLTPIHNIPGHLVYSANGSDVDTVIVDGQIIMQNRKFLTLDVNEVMNHAQSVFEKMLKKGGWKATIAEPQQTLMSAFKLKATQQSLAVIQKLITPVPGKEDPF